MEKRYPFLLEIKMLTKDRLITLTTFFNRLVFFQEEFEHPTEDDLNRVYHVPLQDDGATTSSDQSDHLFRHMTEMTILTVQLIVEFSKHLPGFQTLCRDDQVNINLKFLNP